MRSFAFQHQYGKKPRHAHHIIPANADVFQAYVINQKAVNQNAQQVLTIVAAQLSNIMEAQFGFATNDDSDIVGT
ncbi:hypothetical protein [Dethiobacter alkaliphilus]|uniref:Uncharacterized protein n=1 Tax=Dethiobacter alkaliphilus AHT 1 TaxID=555088 RepID=C0GCP0_DETAL|nr:hypothetical protein [Dethiobacter alkaliphilus]EEG78975.1 hypothetical protein DealDRAFT_0249 [Dethiobacter alkaliphilus AHT 1]